jgi:hypothetical protein
MTVYDKGGEPERSMRDPGAARPLSDDVHYSPRPFRIDNEARTGYRPGWIWVPVAVLFLLIVLVMGTGFMYGGYADRVRGYDNGTLLEQRGGQMTQPSLPTPLANPAPPEIGNSGAGEERSSIPEAAPPLANDGQ